MDTAIAGMGDFAHVPAELRAVAQWLAWRWEERGTEHTKVPLAPRTGRRANVTNPADLVPFAEALAFARARDCGIGFAFAAADPFVGVDLDDCRDPESGDIAPWASGFVALLDSYTEVSPSGTGLKVFARGDWPAGRNRKGDIEVYDRGRFFTVTGQHHAGTPTGAEERTAQLEELHHLVFGAEGAAPAAPSFARTPGTPPDLDDRELLGRAFEAKNGAKFARLWRGDTGEHGGDDSAADLALCSLLAFYAGPDPARIDRLFRQSALYREKWERDDYRERTIAKALSERAEFWSGPAATPATPATPARPGALGASLVCAADIEPRRIEWLLPGRIVRGGLTLIDGDPGLGKSLVTIDLAARLSVGGTLPDGTAAHRAATILIAPEDAADSVLRPRLDAAGADAAGVFLLAEVADGDDRRIFSLPGDLGLLEAAIEQTGAALVVIDPLMAVLDASINSYKDQDIRRVLTPLARLAERTAAAIVVVRHLNKASRSSPLYRGGGSIGIVAAARSALLVARHPDDEALRVVTPLKSNLGPRPLALTYRVEKAANESGRVVWVGECDLSAEDVLDQDADDAGERGRLSEAGEFLLDLLAGGALRATDIQRAARAAGLSWRTVERAKAKLRIISVRYATGGDSYFTWRLPALEAE